MEPADSRRPLLSPNGRATCGTGGGTGEGVVSPPYWYSHQRSNSSASYSSTHFGRTPQITLEDHTEDDSEQCKSLWARHVSIDDHVVVSGNRTGVGAYIVWNCTVETLSVSRLGSKAIVSHRFADDLGGREVR